MKTGEGEKEKESGVKIVPIGIKVGSQNTVITTSDWTEIETTCVKERSNLITGETEYIVGNEAAEMFGDGAEYMLRGGLPGNEEEADLLRRFLGRLIEKYDLPENSYVTYAIPAVESEVGINLFKKVVSQISIGWSGKEIWNDSFLGALALPGGIKIVEKTFLVINLGSTTTEVVAARKGEVLLSAVTGAVSGDLVDRWVKNEILNETRAALNIDLATARKYKEKYANLKSWENVQESVQLFRKGKSSFKISECIIKPIEDYLERLADFVCLEFLPELAETNFSVYKQVLAKEFILVGGMVEIPGLREKLGTIMSSQLGANVTMICPENPVAAPAKGAYTLSKYRTTTTQEQEK